MGEQIYKVRDPQGNVREIKGPEGASDDEVIAQAQKLFSSTPGGAAVGNPNLRRQGDKAMRSDGGFQPLANIGAAGATGGVLGAFSKEILTGAGNVAGALPHPAARTVGGFLKGAGQVIGAGGRTAPAIAGAISGAAGETAGQVAEVAGAGPVAAEGARIVGGGATAETLNLGKEVLKKYILTPALSLASKIKKETAIALLEKIEGAPQSITAKELKFLEEQIAELRGPAGKTDAPLEAVGSIMGDEGKRVLDAADQQLIASIGRFGSVGNVGAGTGQTPAADIGGALRSTITKRNEAAIAARSAQYTANEQARDAIVSQRESAGSFVAQLPEHAALVAELKANLAPGKRSPSVQAGYQKVLDELEGSQSFKALDDVRRKLGDAFRGKPAEGYDAIGETAAKDLYAKVSAIQKKFAGGDTGPQAKLLDDYAAATKGLEQFSSKAGKKATALDQYRDEQFATDASALPATYFKTRASVQALKELTGDAKQVNSAALEFANNELAGKDAAAVRAWLGKNTDWITETPAVRHIVEKYATRLEGAERSLRNAEDFAKQAAKDSSMLTRNALPAQRAVDLIKSGDTELWAKITPAIMQSPQAKTQMVSAVRQVVADQATAKATSDLFSRNIRPFIETSGIGTKAEMDFIAQRLANIQEMKLPEAEKLGLAKRLLLSSTGGWAATAAARAGDSTYQWSKEKIVPE